MGDVVLGIFMSVLFTLVVGMMAFLFVDVIKEIFPRSKTKLPLKDGVTYQHDDYPYGLWTVESQNEQGVKFVQGGQTLYVSYREIKKHTFWEIPRTGTIDSGSGQAITKDPITPGVSKSRRLWTVPRSSVE